MILLSEDDQKSRWVKHFSEILNWPISIFFLDLVDELNNVTDDVDISKDETEEGLRALANSKAAGLDFIPAELLKWDDTMVVELSKIASMVWNTLKVPCELDCGAIVKLQKEEISLNMIIGDV